MGRELRMSQTHTIHELKKRGLSIRKIAREMGIDRKTVAKHLLTMEKGTESVSKPVTESQTQSKCLPYKKLIEEKICKGLSAQRIYQDLIDEVDFPHSYESVKRFVSKTKIEEPKVFARIETPPGFEAQVDFGEGAPTLKNGKYQKPFLFVMTLSFSRHAYQEVVWHQDVETFIRCHENAFKFFGGVVDRIKLDNLKAGVLQANLYEPDLNPLYANFSRHAGFIPLPCRVRKPEHKGKVESGVKYTQNNAIKGRKFERLDDQNKFLLNWNRTIAFKRRHGTTKRIVSEMFEEERCALKPLPEAEFITFKISERRVRPDCYIEVESTYYSVPHYLVGHKVIVHHNAKFVKVLFAHEVVATHKKAQPGFFQTNKVHLPRSKSLSEKELLEQLLHMCQEIGSDCFKWGEKVCHDRTALAVRTLMGIKYLRDNYSVDIIDKACEKSLQIGSIHYHTVKIFCEEYDTSKSEEILEEHELVRDISYYAKILTKGEKNE